jgi:hypothetical protein
VGDLTEGLLNDNNFDFAWLPSDPFNGMTRARTNDDTDGVVFSVDGAGPVPFILWTIPPPAADFSAFKYLSFRAAQGTRHPLTTASLGDFSWIVALSDQTGGISSIDFSAYGGGIEEPYQRTGFGAGAGWQNEFETIRIRLTDFTTGQDGVASNLNLTDIKWVLFVFFDPVGTAMARLGLDDLELTVD